MERGSLYCVSTGPGDPMLMTLKAVQMTEQCPVVALSVDFTRRDKSCGKKDTKSLKENCAAYQIAAPVVKGIEGKEYLFLSMPMTKDKEVLSASHRQAADRIIEYLSQGISVAWLTLGDTTIYASSLYAARLVKEGGYQVELISGVPSFCAAAARLGEPLVSGSQQLHILPSSYRIEEALACPGTKVLMKAGSRLSQVKKLLTEQGFEAKGVQRCGMKGEKVYPSAAELDEEAGYYTLLIVKERD